MSTAACSDDPFVLTDDYQVMPPLSDEEFEALKADIKADGVQDPIVHDEEMQVIDGHHRVKACRDLGRDMADVPTDVRAGYTDDEKRDLAYRLNLQRRHLEHGEKSALVEQYLTEEWDGDNSDGWYEDIATDLGVSKTTVTNAFTELKEAGKFSKFGIFSKEDKREQVRQYLTENPDATNREVANAVEADVSHATVGNWKNEYGWLEDDDEEDNGPEQPKVQAFGRGKDAEDRAEQTEKLIDKATDEDAGEEVRETAAEKAGEVSRGETAPDEAVDEVGKTENSAEKKQTREQKRGEFAAAVEASDAVQVQSATVQELSAALDAESVDCIITDPPYDEDAVNDWAQLAEVADNVLKPGGLLAAYSGKYHLPAVHDALGEYLEYYWQFIIRHTDAGARIWPRNIRTDYKPVLVYAKPPVEGLETLTNDVIEGGGREKDDHEWQQATAEAVELVERLTEPNDLILDPMCGSGTTGVAALHEQRRVILSDRDGEAVETARGRVADVL